MYDYVLRANENEQVIWKCVRYHVWKVTRDHVVWMKCLQLKKFLRYEKSYIIGCVYIVERSDESVRILFISNYLREYIVFILAIFDVETANSDWKAFSSM